MVTVIFKSDEKVENISHKVVGQYSRAVPTLLGSEEIAENFNDYCRWADDGGNNLDD